MPQGWVLARFIGLEGRGSELSFCPGGGARRFCRGRGGGGGMVMRLYERFSRNCQKSMFVLAYGHLLLEGDPLHLDISDVVRC